MNELDKNGTQALPAFYATGNASGNIDSIQHFGGMTLRDWFAGTIQYDKSIMEDVGACDDQDLLERYGTEAEKDEGFRLVLPNGPMPIMNIILRQKLESRARAELRYIEADAMLEARKRGE
jgi:hypothetical protein